jgi:hypothetical protein
MKIRSDVRLTVAGVVAGLALGLAAGAQDPEVQSWQQPYAGAEASGPTVLGLWQFQPGTEAEDNSGNGHALKLRGSGAFALDGRFGSCLESFGPGDTDKASGAEVRGSEKLTPPGAFTLELWIKPKPELATQPRSAWLLDKMYVNYKHKDPTQECQRDYGLTLGAAVDGQRTLQAYLGFGTAIETCTSRPLRFEPGVWRHLAFAYDGAGTGTFYCDGAAVGGGTFPDRQGVNPGTRALVIGDRFGSSQGGFPGFISQVRLSNTAIRFYSGTLGLAASGRTVFVRMEKEARVEWTVTSNRSTPLSGARLILALEGCPEQQVALPALAVGASHTLELPVDTRGRPGTYLLKARAEGADGKALADAVSFPLTLVARPLPRRLPVVMWGGPNLTDDKGLALLKKIGFTHSLSGPPVDHARIWKDGKPGPAADQGAVESYRRLLDRALANGISVAAYPGPGRWLDSQEGMKRVDRAGKVYEGKSVQENICGNSPGAQEFCYNVGASIAQSFGAYPGLQAALIHSEVRDNSQVCFHEWDRAEFRRAAGFDIPDQVYAKNGVSYRALKDFPLDRVIADDDPLLAYYRWFWKNGDGWNPLHSAVHRGLKSTGRNDLWTWFDPAVRVPSTYGSGGEVDVVSQWTYSYPDPIKIWLATDELFAMAAGAKQPQQVMKMTQIIWYRSGTAPKPKPGEESKSPKATWQESEPDADFITISPDHLREAFWCKLARPIQGIMYHGWESLVPTGSKGGYRFTNPETQAVLGQLARDVIQPLGPALLQVPDRQSDVGYLESFSSQIFAGKGSWGWGGADTYLILLYAELQPQVLYDETISARGLDGFKVLVLADCDVLTRTVATKIQEFQRRGGLVVADEFLTPAIVPDIRLRSYRRTGKADLDKAAILEQAAALRQDLDPFYRRYADASTPEVITRVRSYGSTDYLFAANDRREYGDYVGQYGLVMEKGLPTTATLTLNRTSGSVYDLTAGKALTATASAGTLRIEREFGPGGGTVLMVTARPIAGVRLTLPEQAQLGGAVTCEVAIVDADGKPLEAVVPVRLDVLDAEGKTAEFSGFYGAKDGRFTVTLDLAANDPTGKWQIRATELASGQTAERGLKVNR